MIQNQSTDGEEEPLIRGKTNFYGDSNNENDDYSWRSRTPSLSDALDNKFTLNRKPSRLEWAQSSWIRLPYVLFWWWLNPILHLGNKQTLTDDDLDDLTQQDKCSVLLKKLLIYDWSTTTTWRIIFHSFGKQTFYIGLILFPLVAVRVAQPLFLRAIIRQLFYKDNIAYHVPIGIMLATGMFLCSIIQSVCFQHILFLSTKLGMRIRNALSASIYRHLLTINMSSLQQTTFGQTINLVANDASKFEEFWIHGHFLWAAPLEAIITFGLLSWTIGFLPTIFAFILLLLLIPLQLLFSRYFSHYHQRTMASADKRIKAYSELLDGCHIIKMYNWEKAMEERVQTMREDELASIKLASHLRALNMALFFVSPCMMALLAFGGIWLLDFQLKPSDIFTALAFFGQIRLPLISLMPLGIERLSAMLVASKRIDAFMRLKPKTATKAAITNIK